MRQMEESTELVIPVRITPELVEYVLEKLREVWDTIQELWREVVKRLQHAAVQFSAWLRSQMRRAEPKLYHLAFHAKRHRVRKKNLRRLLQRLAAP